MEKKRNEDKRMVCTFKKDGSVTCTYDANIIDEAFMGILYNTINELADIWFEFVEDSKKAKEKIKPFEIKIKI